MIEDLNQLLNSTEPTGYKTIAISIITTIITSILICYRKVVQSFNYRALKFKIYRRFKYNIQTNSDIEYFKNKQKERELKDYEKKAIKRYYKNKYLKGNIYIVQYEIEELKTVYENIDFDMLNRLSNINKFNKISRLKYFSLLILLNLLYKFLLDS
ncbi:MAG: hypothetical protein RSE41_10070 [Clostridia bacterium]